ncbi:MAG: Rpn family recombination-promoting nuclease/putative transposase [Cyanobacteria bacterium P01_A01_bin.116]
MSLFINPKTDFAFKKIFGSPQSKDILINFLNALLYEGESVIEDLQILDPYQAPQIEGIKQSYLDVKAKLNDGTDVIIEMQVLNVLGFEKRVLYNAAKAFSTQLKAGDSYDLLNPVIALTITDFEMFEHSDRVVSRYQLKEKTDLTTYSDDIELIFAELPKFTKTIDELDSLTDKWLYFLKEADNLDAVPPNLEKEAAIHDAFEIAQQSRLTRDEMEVLDKQAMFIHDSRNAVRLGIQQGLKKGLQKGIEQGIEQGLEQGIEQGKREERVAIARSLIGKLSATDISQITQLSVDDINQLTK